MSCSSSCVAPTTHQCHCGSGCHQTFGSISGFDKHRRNGSCLDPATLHMHLNAAGVWRMDGARGERVDQM